MENEQLPPERSHRYPEMEAIAYMLKRSAEFSLDVEVILAFGNSRAAGFATEVACQHALYEWDI